MLVIIQFLWTNVSKTLGYFIFKNISIADRAIPGFSVSETTWDFCHQTMGREQIQRDNEKCLGHIQLFSLRLGHLSVSYRTKPWPKVALWLAEKHAYKQQNR